MTGVVPGMSPPPVVEVSVALATALLLAACAAPPPPRRCAARPATGSHPSLLADAGFGLRAWDSGPVLRRCLAAAPWGAASWGVEAATFRDADGASATDRSIDGARLAIEGGVASLRARDTTGRWSFARFVQGDLWDGTSCGPVPWRRLPPLFVAGPPLELDLDVCLEESSLESLFGSWILLGANVWLTAPGEKPLVLDLMVHHRTNMLGVRDASHEDEVAYHYQVEVAEARPSTWTPVTIDLTRQVRDAARHFGLERRWADLTVRQVEIVAEVHHATAAARFDDFTLRTSSRTPRRAARSGATGGLQSAEGAAGEP